VSNSAVKCENLATVETALVLRKIGDAIAALMDRVNEALKFSLELA
jgi:mRNA-degrading endonuclease toxin of MazEF toxin-antitoxin module